MKTSVCILSLFFPIHFAMAGDPIPAVSILNADGTMKNKGPWEGIVDFTGFRVSLDPEVGLVFESASSNPEWMNITPGAPGNADYISAIAVYQDYVYVGGKFDNAGGNPAADNIARWDGCEWHSVFVTSSYYVIELVVHAGNLYIGGWFYDANGNPDADNIAIWDGSNLTALGNGLNLSVDAIDVAPYGVVAAGWFTDAGGNPEADTIAIWDGTNWNALGSGLNGFPLELHVIGNDTYVGGAFTNAGGVANTNHIARWDGTAWHALETGLNWSVYSMTSREDELYVGGQFTNAGGNPDANKVALWHENSWHNLDSQFPNGVPGVAWSLYLSEEHLYVGYSSTGIIYQWDLVNESWDEFPPDYPGLTFIQDMAWHSQYFYVGAHNGSGENGSLWRWGEPAVTIVISGVPDIVCLTDPPLPLPTTQSGYTGTWSGPYVTNNVFDPQEALENIQIIFTPDVPCAGGVPFEIDVVYFEEFPLDLPNTMCQEDPPLPLSENLFGVTGEWSGEGVINSVFYPAGLSGGITLTFTPDPGQCLDPLTGTIEVSPWIDIVLMGIPNEVCESDDPVYLNPIQDGISGFWFGPGVDFSFFDPAGLNGTITLTFMPDQGECAGSETFDIEIIQSVTISISGIPNSLCQLSTPIALPTLQSGIQGEWNGPGVTNNTFNPSGLLGNITINFIPESGTCAFPAPTMINVYITVTQITGVPANICITSPPIPLPTNQGGIVGNWTGPGVSANTFNPIGQNGLVILTFTPDANQCATQATQNIFVNPLSIPIITGVPSTLCVESPPIALPPVQNGYNGNWSGEGVSSNFFNPNSLTGNIELLFTPDPGQCAASNTMMIFITPIQFPTISGIPTTLCVIFPPIPLPTEQQGINGAWSGPGVVNDIFDPSNQSGILTITFTPNADQCANAADWILEVTLPVVPIITGIPTSICQSNSPYNLPTIEEGFTGSWSGLGVMNNVFVPAGLTGIVNLVFEPDPGQCASNAETTIQVEITIPINLTGIPDSLCEIDSSVVLPNIQDGILGNWSGPGVSDNTFNPVGQIGSVQITFTPDSAECAFIGHDTILLTAAQLPTITGVPNAFCTSDSPFDLPDIQDGIIGNWSGGGVDSNIFTSVNLSGIQTLIFNPNPGQCAKPAVLQVALHQSPRASNLNVSCDSFTHTYIIEFDITGGDPSSYMVNGSPVEGSHFISSPIPSDSTTYSFLLNDKK